MARFFIDHPVFAIVIAIVIVIMGVVAIPTLPVASYPDIVPPVVQISAGYLGGNAQDLEKTVAQNRKAQVGTGERSEKIRTYNFPQNRVTDHRVGVTLHKLEQVLEGDLGELVQALKAQRQQEVGAA